MPPQALKANMMELKEFQNKIMSYYNKNKRNLPWRNTRDPYKILISEVMLQQTQVSRVLVKYPQFIKEFPDFKSLAKASLTSVLAVWQGMGYNRRAIYLKKISGIVINKFNGKMPSDPKVLETLPGIGKATAGSIMAFVFNKKSVFIETNIRRVFIHFFFTDKQNINDKDIMSLVEAALDQKNARDWYYALMDYGAMLASKGDNPNKRSKHYSKQAPFVGSVRQIRGAVLRHLLKNGSIEIKTFPKTVLAQMEKEGFIEERQGRYYAKS